MGNVSITMIWKNDIVVVVDWAHKEWMNIRTCTSRWFTAIKQSDGACISGHMDMRIFLRTQPAWRVQTNHEGIINLSASSGGAWSNTFRPTQAKPMANHCGQGKLGTESDHSVPGKLACQFGVSKLTSKSLGSFRPLPPKLPEPHLEVCRPSSRIKRPERGSQPAEWRMLRTWLTSYTIPLGDLNQYVDHHRRLGGTW